MSEDDKTTIDDETTRILKESSELPVKDLYQILIKNPFLVNAYNSKGETLLSYSIKNKNRDISNLILTSPILEIEHQDKEGNSYLHLAVLKSEESVIKLLIEKGIFIDQQNNDGNTALHLAYQVNKNNIIDILKENGAEINIKNLDGKKADELKPKAVKIKNNIYQKTKITNNKNIQKNNLFNSSDSNDIKRSGRKNNQNLNKSNLSKNSTQNSKAKRINKQNTTSVTKNGKIRNKFLTSSNDNTPNESKMNISETKKKNLSIFTTNSKKYTDFDKSEKSDIDNNNIISMEKNSPQNKNNIFKEVKTRKSKQSSGKKIADKNEILNIIESDSKKKPINNIEVNSQNLKNKNKVIKNAYISPKNKIDDTKINITTKNPDAIYNYIPQNSKINEIQYNENHSYSNNNPNNNNFDYNTINNVRNYCEANNGLQFPIYTSAILNNNPQMFAINGNEIPNVINPALLFSNPQLVYQNPNLYINHRKTAVVNNVNINNLIPKKNFMNQNNNANNIMSQKNMYPNFQQISLNDNNNSKNNNQDIKNIKKIATNKENKPLIEFLSQINMLKYLNNLINNGFDDINLFIEVAKGGEVIKDQELKEAGVDIPGDRAKILIRLQEKANYFGFVVPKIVYYSCQNLDDIEDDKNINKLKNWLENLKMGDYLMNFLTNGYHTIELLLMQMETANPLTNEILKDEIGIEKIGYRSRIINKLKDEGRSLKHKLQASALIVNQGENDKNCECVMF